MAQPLLRIVRGEPTAEELAALLTVLRARTCAAAATADRAVPRPSTWADRSRLVRHPLIPGPGAWRAGAFTR